MTAPVFHLILPSLSPVGGIQKCFDYANHASDFGFDVRVYSPETPASAPKLFEREDFAYFVRGGATFLKPRDLTATNADIVFFSLPTDFRHVEPLLKRGLDRRRIVHIIQNTRHANPDFQKGYALKLLSQPLLRIAINQIVRDHIAPHLSPDLPCDIIQLAHNTAYFSHQRAGGVGKPVTIGYMTWKSDIGDRVERMCAGQPDMRFKAIRQPVGWPALRDFYREIDIFLAAPLRQEGFYLPGLEAMAAGCLVVIPDVEGNMAYCKFDLNSLPYEFDSPTGAAEAIRHLIAKSPSAIDALRLKSYQTAKDFSLDKERRHFGEFLLRNRLT